MATIEFNDYIIEKSLYESNDKFKDTDEDGKLLIEDIFKAEVGISEGKGFVRLLVSLGDREKKEKVENIPFFLEVNMRGIFDYTLEDNEKDYETIKQLLCSNAIAIMYPYLRTYIQFLTANSNQFPTYTLPVMNFAKMLKDENLVKFYSDIENGPAK